MTLNYGQPANPEAYVIGVLQQLSRPVGPERDQDDALPSYTVTAVAGKSNKFILRAVVSVHSFGNSRAQAADAAWDADKALLAVTPGDVITLPDNSTASAYVTCVLPPIYADYRDPFVKRYAARYDVQLRFTATQS